MPFTFSETASLYPVALFQTDRTFPVSCGFERWGDQSSSQSQREKMTIILYKGLCPDGGKGSTAMTNCSTQSCLSGRASVFFRLPGYE